MCVRILKGDCREILRSLDAESVQTCITSPPYWGLRDYGVEGQIGLEGSPDEWAAGLVEVFREVRRVLRPDGVCWINCGDGYDAGTRASRDYSKTTKHGYWNNPNINNRCSAGLKPKDLIGMPWLLAFALRADGWYLRAEVIWSKPSPMPESVTDRPTKAHEQIFLLTKSLRYFYDAEAIKEPASPPSGGRQAAAMNGDGRYIGEIGGEYHEGRPGRFSGYQPLTRNARSVWTIASEPFPEAHFATFPTELARRCILAGTSEKGCCPACGAPWARAVERSSLNLSNAAKAGTTINGKGHVSSQVREGHDVRNGPTAVNRTLGWTPICHCDADEPVPCTVLDPFGGSGTVGLVADQLRRNAVLIELSPEYAEMARCRIENAAGLFADVNHG